MAVQSLSNSPVRISITDSVLARFATADAYAIWSNFPLDDQELCQEILDRHRGTQDPFIAAAREVISASREGRNTSEALGCRLRCVYPKDRFAAALLLRYLGNQEEVPELRRCLRDRNVAVRWAAAFALGELEDTAAIPDLLSVLDECIVNKPLRHYQQALGGSIAVLLLLAGLRGYLTPLVGEIGIFAAAVGSLIGAIYGWTGLVRVRKSNALVVVVGHSLLRLGSEEVATEMHETIQKLRRAGKNPSLEATGRDEVVRMASFIEKALGEEKLLPIPASHTSGHASDLPRAVIEGVPEATSDPAPPRSRRG